MLSRPRSLLFWLVLIILLYIIAIAPIEFAHAIVNVWQKAEAFFTSLAVFVHTLAASL
ncbi:hypothetical protein GCM10010358_73180 [Streptomyces minutiscleroticus]|uniref:Uncharacterized protein n=1 Tax=Streptomyces minutiscleroticus TaxID=68238 RepID=A0A918U850_9ACTN|nr:hypothetical protein [Streptomyces minutiscleroticus]GGY09874.1 hypothetical protein GCM10010358_73180 [Streptomyces minutiscleroticus]